MVDFGHSTQRRDWLFASKEVFREKVKKVQKRNNAKIDKFAGSSQHVPGASHGMVPNLPPIHAIVKYESQQKLLDFAISRIIIVC